MSQADPTQAKRVSKDTPRIAQFRESVVASNKRQEPLQNNKDPKAQGVGSTLPTSCIATTKLKDSEMEEAKALSEDESFDPIFAKIQAKEYKQLKLLDEAELQKLWDQGGMAKGKVASSLLASTSTNAPKDPNAKVQPHGPSQRILVSTQALSPAQGASAKQKRSTGGRKGSKLQKANGKEEPEEEEPEEGEGGEEEKEGGDEDGDENNENNEDSKMEDGNKGNKGQKSLKKSGTGKSQCGQMKDFTGKVKKMVDYTTICTCTKLAVSRMFGTPSKYKAIVSKGWMHVAAVFGVDLQDPKYQLQKPHRQAIWGWINSFCSQMRNQVKHAIVSTYKLIGTPNEIKKWVGELIPNQFHTKVSSKQGLGHFQHEYIQEAIYEIFYTGDNPVALAYPKWFDPMPLEAIALVCAVIQWVITQHKSGKYNTKSQMTFKKLCKYYNNLMNLLRAFQSGKQAEQCVVVQIGLYMRCMEQAGHLVVEEEVKPGCTALGEDNFAKDIPTVEELKLLAWGSNACIPTKKPAKKPPTVTVSTACTVDKSCPCSKPAKPVMDKPAVVAPATNKPATNKPATNKPATDKPATDKPAVDDAALQPGIPSPTTSSHPTQSQPDCSSSITLDYKGSEDKDLREETPTPPSHDVDLASTKRPNDNRNNNKEDESDRDDGSSTHSDKDPKESQPPPKKCKTKGTASSNLVQKLQASWKKSGKPSPGAALKLGNIKITKSTGSSKGKVKK